MQIITTGICNLAISNCVLNPKQKNARTSQGEKVKRTKRVCESARKKIKFINENICYIHRGERMFFIHRSDYFLGTCFFNIVFYQLVGWLIGWLDTCRLGNFKWA